MILLYIGLASVVWLTGYLTGRLMRLRHGEVGDEQ